MRRWRSRRSVVEIASQALGLVPAGGKARVVESSIAWDYTTFLNLAFLALAAALVIRFGPTGGPRMLRMMEASPGPASRQPAHAH